ncbi:Hsp70 family protein [Streptomyces sp. NPDC000410]|uniref:Hsp70 family protein n=1 Tax=Streptomyces sp. NPDC000410 TaxID=3154254 RepID=UPI003324A4C0
MSVLGIDIGHRYGRIGWTGGDGRPVVATTLLERPDAPAAALTALRALVPDTGGDPEDTEAAIGLAPGGQDLTLLRAVGNAGLNVRHSVPEPVAAALHYAAVVEGVDRTVLVCDQGATTLDLTVLSITPDRTVRVVDSRTHLLGGDDWDEVVAVELTRRFPGARGDGDPRPVAERLRRLLDERETASVGELTLDRETLDRLVAPLRERARAAVAEALAAAAQPPDAVLLAGGLSATPGTAAALEAHLGLLVRCTAPELAVVRGLLALEDFGLLRILSGPASPPAALRKAPEPAATPAPAPVEDPEPQWWQRREDPEPPAARAGADSAGGRTEPYAAPGPDPARSHVTRPPETPAETLSGTTADTPPRTTANTTVPAPDAFAPTPNAADAFIPAPDAPDAFAPDPTAPFAPTPDPTAPSATQPPSPDPGSPAREDGAAPVHGPLVAVPVDQLQAMRRGEHLLVLWAWPPDALTARVRWRVEGDSPDNPLDTGDMRCLRRVYEHDGGLVLPVGRGAVTLTVEALAPADPSIDCEGSSSLIVAAEGPVVEYEPSVRRRLKGRFATVTFSCETGCELPPVRIVHGIGRYRPTSTAEGTVLYEVPAQRLPARVPVSVEFPLPATREPSWLVCFPADADTDIDIRPTALHRLRVT